MTVLSISLADEAVLEAFLVQRKALVRLDASMESTAIATLARDTLVIVNGLVEVDGTERCRLQYPM